MDLHIHITSFPQLLVWSIALVAVVLVAFAISDVLRWFLCLVIGEFSSYILVFGAIVLIMLSGMWANG